MAKPTIVPSWATDATYANPGRSWDGDPTKIDAGAAKRAQGYEPTEQVAAEVLNYDLNAVGEWLAWLDATHVADGQHNYEAPIVRETRVHPGEFKAVDGTASFTWDPATTSGRPGILQTTSSGLVRARLPLVRYLPNNAHITQIRACVEHGGIGGSIAMKLANFKLSFSSWVVSGVAGAIADSEVTLDSVAVGGRALLDSGAVAYDVTPANGYILIMELSGDDQSFYELEVDWTDYGMTNI